EATAKAKELEFLEGKNQFAPSSSSPAHKKARSSLSSAASLSAPARAVLVACEGKEQPQQALKALGRDFADLPLDTLTEASVVVSKLEEIVDGMKGKVPQ
ncbi:dna mismatch repair protein msh4 partial, partial [Nannochloropsis oceanica]